MAVFKCASLLTVAYMPFLIASDIHIMSAKPQLKKSSWYVYLVLAFLRVLSTSALSAADCVDSHDNCQYWSTIGECEQNPNYMLANCKHSCKICTAAYDDVDDNSTRCGGAIDQLPNALEASSLCTMFERIVQDYNPTIHSQPTAEDDMPWIITIDNFVTDEEIDRILQYGESNGYEQSRETYHGNHDGSKTTQMRTSENSWCGYQVSRESLPLLPYISYIPIVLRSDTFPNLLSLYH